MFNLVFLVGKGVLTIFGLKSTSHSIRISESDVSVCLSVSDLPPFRASFQRPF